MSEDVRTRCLEPFFSTKGDKGTGLGLSMVFGTIKRHNGTLDIESAVGHGSTFRMRLPVENKAMATEAVEPIEAAQPSDAVEAKSKLADMKSDDTRFAKRVTASKPSGAKSKAAQAVVP